MLREIIKKEKELQNISYYRLAKMTELQPTQIKNYLEGKNDLVGCNIEKLLKALHIWELELYGL